MKPKGEMFSVPQPLAVRLERYWLALALLRRPPKEVQEV